MSMQRSFALPILAVVVASTHAAPRPHADEDWLKVPTHTVSAKVEDIAFTIELPVDIEDKEPHNKSTRHWQDEDDYYAQPHVTVSVFDYEFPKTVKEAEGTFLVPKAQVIKSELTKDRYTAVSKMQTFVAATVLVRVGKRGLLCEAGKSHVPAMTNQDALAPWYEKLCASIKLR